MAFAQIKREGGIGSGTSRNERIIQEIKDLGIVALSEKEMDNMTQLFNDNSKHIQFILSNEEEFQKVNSFCDKIELFLKSPMRIEAEKSVAQKVNISCTNCSYYGGYSAYFLCVQHRICAKSMCYQECHHFSSVLHSQL